MLPFLLVWYLAPADAAKILLKQLCRALSQTTYVLIESFGLNVHQAATTINHLFDFNNTLLYKF